MSIQFQLSYQLKEEYSEIARLTKKRKNYNVP